MGQSVRLHLHLLPRLVAWSQAMEGLFTPPTEQRVPWTSLSVNPSLITLLINQLPSSNTRGGGQEGHSTMRPAGSRAASCPWPKTQAASVPSLMQSPRLGSITWTRWSSSTTRRASKPAACPPWPRARAAAAASRPWCKASKRTASSGHGGGRGASTRACRRRRVSAKSTSTCSDRTYGRLGLLPGRPGNID